METDISRKEIRGIRNLFATEMKIFFIGSNMQDCESIIYSFEYSKEIQESVPIKSLKGLPKLDHNDYSCLYSDESVWIIGFGGLLQEYTFGKGEWKNQRDIQINMTEIETICDSFFYKKEPFFITKTKKGAIQVYSILKNTKYPIQLTNVQLPKVKVISENEMDIREFGQKKYYKILNFMEKTNQTYSCGEFTRLLYNYSNIRTLKILPIASHLGDCFGLTSFGIITHFFDCLEIDF